MIVKVLVRSRGVVGGEVAGGYLKQPATKVFALWVAFRGKPKEEWNVDIIWVPLPGMQQPTCEECRQAIVEKLTPKKKGR